MRRLAVIAIVVLLIVLFGVGQLVLPGIAAQRLRDRLTAAGQVVSVKVTAFPAIELLWHQADDVVVRMQSYRSQPGPLGGMLGQANSVGSIDASVGALYSGLLTLHDATLTKRGSSLTGSARITDADLRTAVPFLSAVHPIASSGGQLTLQGTATLLGISATVNATVAALNGSVVVQPNVPFGALATVTVFSNPALEVQSVSAGNAAGGFSVSAQGRLR